MDLEGMLISPRDRWPPLSALILATSWEGIISMGKLGHRRGKVTVLSLPSFSSALLQARKGGADGEKIALQQD